MTNVYVARLNFANKLLFSEIISGLRNALPVNVIEYPINLDLAPFFSDSRGQYFSTQIIYEVSKLTGELDGKVLLLTDVDLYVPVLTFVFGEAQLRGKHSIISLCRLHEEFYSGETNNQLLYQRAMKEALHELGHNMGLTHCTEWDCVMHSSLSIEQVDVKGNNFCNTCIEEMNLGTNPSTH